MEYPPPWEVLPEADFELAVPRDPGHLGVELMAQVRMSGRIQDHFRLVIGGDQLLEFNVPLASCFSLNEAPRWVLAFSLWPRDVTIRCNTSSSAWMDLRDLVASNDIQILNETGENVANGSFVDLLAANVAANKPPISSSVRWAVIAGDGDMPALQLQLLPFSSAVLDGKPMFKG